ncbi:hypothetical protein HPX47_004521 [Vibrio alginolyticus]|nr:hypothetical protein [Vibrio alginolyticus]
MATSLAVTPADASVAKGLTQQYIATLTLSDDSTEDVTAEAATSWTSGSAATINAVGLAKGESVGEAQITASGTYDGVVLQNSTTLTVTAAEISNIVVTPTTTIAKGLTQQFTAEATFTDMTTRDITTDMGTNWVSKNVTVATVSTSGIDKGLATGNKIGTAMIQASNRGASGVAELTVSPAVLNAIIVTPDTPSVAVGATSYLTATGIYSDGSEKDITSLVGWTGQETNIATVGSKYWGGQVTGVHEGTTMTTASLVNSEGITISSLPVYINVTVPLLEIVVSPTNWSIVGDDTRQLTAIGIYQNGSHEDITQNVHWNVDDNAVAVVSEGIKGGIASKGKRNGATNVTAQLDDIVSNSVYILTCDSLAEACIDLFDATNGDGTGTLYTNSPSTEFVDFMVSQFFTPNEYFSDSDKWYEYYFNGVITADGSNGPVGDFYTLKYRDLCVTYNHIKLGGRDDWFFPRVYLLSDLFDKFGNMYERRGWPVIRGYWGHAEPGNSSIYTTGILLDDGMEFDAVMSRGSLLMSCMSYGSDG